MTEYGPRKRSRAAKSCEQCRRRKVRCDLASPCGACIRSRASLACYYGNERVDASPPRESLGESEHVCLPATIQGPDALSRVQPQQPNRETDYRPIARGPEVEHALQELTEKVQKLEQLALNTRHVDAQADENDALSVTATRPRLLAPASKVKFLGPTHWAHKVDGLKFTQPINGTETEPSFQKVKAELGNIVKECRGLRHSVKSQQSVRLNDPISDLLGTIPAKAVCDGLVHSYLRAFELIYRVIHIPLFWKEYVEFWEHPKATARPFLMKLVLILAIGSTFYAHGGAITDRPYLHVAQKWIYAAQWWLTGPSEKSTFSLDGLQVFCLLLISRQATGLGASPWLSTGSLLKMAMAMGLHRDPANFPALTVFQSEMRVRLWTVVLELTVQSSLDSGTPILLPQDFSGRGPMNIDDQDICPDTVIAPKLKNQPTESSIQILLRESLNLRVEAIRLINSNNPQSYEKALSLGAELRDACRKIASFFYLDNSCQPTHGLRASNFHRIFLDMQIRRYILFLHTPFMIQARKKPQYYYSRKVCLESAMVIASYADNLNLPRCELDDLSRLIMIGKGPFKGPLSLDIISALGLEIITQLEEEPPAQSSTHQAPDQLDELVARANRAPVISKLEHILNQLHQIIELGCPSFKRYGVLAAMLGQIRAMQSGQCVKEVVYDTLKQGLKECYTSLEASTARGPVQALMNETSASIAQNPPDLGLPWFDANLTDPTLDLELPSLFGVPGLEDIDNFVFPA